jgi:HK97 family phage portal protein
VGLLNYISNVKNAMKYLEETRYLTQGNNYQQIGNFKTQTFGNTPTALINNSYEKNVEVYAVVKKIIDISKSIPWIVERKVGEEWQLFENNTINDLMEKPNQTKGYTWNDIEEQTLLYLTCTGNTYLFGESPFGSGKFAELDVLPSQSVTISSNDNFFLPILKYKFDLGKTKKTFTNEELLHIKFFNPSYTSVEESYYGLSAIEVAKKVVQSSNDRWDADVALLQNRGAIVMITDKSNRQMLPEEASQAQEAIDQKLSGTDKFGKVVITNKDLSYIQLAMSSADLQLIEKGIINLRAICNVFGLDSSLFNDPENKTYSNRTEAEKSMFTNCIIPLSDKVAEHYTKYICENHYPNQYVRMRQDFSKVEVLQENYKEKADTLIALKNAGIINASYASMLLNAPVVAETNPLVDILRGVPALVANNLIGAMTENEIRTLLNLRATTEPTLNQLQTLRNQAFDQTQQ